LTCIVTSSSSSSSSSSFIVEASECAAVNHTRITCTQHAHRFNIMRQHDVNAAQANASDALRLAV